MCLDNITSRSRSKEEFVAYQVFRLPTRFSKSKCKLRSRHIFAAPPKIGVWQQAANWEELGKPTKLSLGYSDNKYPPGFHCYPTLAAAEARARYDKSNGVSVVVRKVKIRKRHTIGVQDFNEVWVASERKILPLRKKKGT